MDRFLVCRPRYMGDILLTTPLLRYLKENVKNCFVTYLVEDRYKDILVGNPCVDDILIIPKGLKQTLDFWKEIRKMNYSAAIDLFCNPRTAIIFKGLKAKKKIGYDVGLRGCVYDSKIKVSSDPSAIISHLSAVKNLEMEIKEYRTEFHFMDYEKEKLVSSEIKDKIRNRFVVGLYPGASWQSKIWHIDNFVELGRNLAETGVIILILYGINDKNLAEYLKLEVGENAIMAPETNIRALAVYLSICNLVIGNDCGPMHLSVAVGTTTWAIFGAEDPSIWFPYSEPHEALAADAECRPCNKTYCKKTICLDNLKADSIIMKFKEKFCNQ